MGRLIKLLFFLLLVRPLVLLVLGLNIVNRQQLPLKGPAVIAANHNSHLDALVLMSLFPLSQLHRVRPVAAADYFLRNRYLAWFALNVIGIIPLVRRGFQRDLFAECHAALDRGDILILFPEGSRGDPEVIGPLKKGIYKLVTGRADIEVTPVVMHGLGRALPRGESLLVPFNCDVIIGEPFQAQESAEAFLARLRSTYDGLFQFCLTRNSD